MKAEHDGVWWYRDSDGRVFRWNESSQEWAAWGIGTEGPQPPPHFLTPVPRPAVYRGPAKTAHGAGYWLFIGWWLGPLKWGGRVFLWLFAWPLGLWRSLVKGRKTQAAKERRGWQR